MTVYLIKIKNKATLKASLVETPVQMRKCGKEIDIQKTALLNALVFLKVENITYPTTHDVTKYVRSVFIVIS
jgi:hypothetical protein